MTFPPRVLDREALLRLRRLVRGLRDRGRASLPLAELVALARTFEQEAGLTVDFEAARELGDPLVVLRPRTPDSPALSGLSRREHSVAECVARGLTNKEIADRLCISLGTVKDHVHHILRKTGLPNRAAIAAACRGA